MVGTLTRSIRILLVACLVRWASPTAAASDFAANMAETASSMRNWRAADGQGLPSDFVTAVVQTHDGFIWVGTTAGLVRFDGVKFTSFGAGVASRNNLTGVTALCEDSSGFLWIGTQQNGLFELADGHIYHYSKDEGLLSDNVTSLASDNRGRVWIGSHSGLNLWTGQKFNSFTKRDGLPDDSVSSVSVARSGTVWITTRVGMSRFMGNNIVPYDFQTESQGRSPEYLGAYEDQRGNLWAFGDTYLINLTEGQRFNYFRSSEAGSLRIWSLCEGRDGRLWIGTSGRGLFCFQENRFQPVILHEDAGPYDVRSICEDHEGNLWLGTSGGGLVQLRLQSVFVLREGLGLPEGMPTALSQDAEGRVYVGMERGGVWKGESGKFDPVAGNESLQIQDFITSVCASRDGTVWAGTYGDGLYGVRNGMELHYTMADGLVDNLISDICLDGEGTVWIGTGSGVLQRLTNNGVAYVDDPKNGDALRLTAMAPAASGDVWLGTQTGRILRESAGKLKIIESAGSISNKAVLTLCEKTPQRLWIGTAGGGLFCLASSNLLNWNTNSGLPSGFVTGVVEDGLQNLWLTTPAGIFRVNSQDLHRALNDPANPLPCKLVSSARTEVRLKTIGGSRLLLTPDGYLWFATSEGMLNIDTRKSQAETPPFPVYIESAAINGEKPISLLKGQLWSSSTTNNPFRAPVDLRSLEIYFTALSYGSPGEIQFRHKLEGSDQDWVYDGGARSFRYTQMRRGAYNFRVSARLGDGPWLESANAFRFIVPTPFYYQAWAICIYVLLAITFVAMTVRIISHRRLRRRLARLEQQRTLERERMRIARDMHDEMGSKLTKISFLSEHMQMDAESGGLASEKIQSIAQTSRDLLKTMDEIVWVVNPHNDTLENLVTYLSHHAVEYFQNTRVDCEIRLPQEVPDLPLSSEARHNLFLAFEETLNNVLKHSNATKVYITMNVRAHEFELAVVDNGRGFTMPDPAGGNGSERGGHGGNGLRNIRQRLSAAGGRCSISSAPGAGTTITMTVWLNEKRSK